MAGDLITSAALQNMLKDYYMETAQDKPMDVYVKMYDEIYKNTKDVDGIAVKAIAKVQRGLGIQTGAFTDSAEPTAGARGYQRATIQPRFIKAKGMFDQQLALMSKGPVGAFVRELATVVEDIDQSIKLNLARQVFGDGSGKLATLTSLVALGAGATVYVHTTQYLEIGMPIAIWSAAAAFIEATTIITVSPETKSFTANIANNLASLSYITLGESAAISSHLTELTGLSKAIDKTSTYFGISRANYPVWRGAVYDGAAATGLAIQRPGKYDEVDANLVVNSILQRSRSKGTDGNVAPFDWLLTDMASYSQAYANEIANRRYMDNASYKTGVTGLMIDNKQVERDAYCNVESAHIGRITVNADPTFTMLAAPNTVLTTSDKLEVYRGITCIGHLSGLNTIGAVTFAATFTAHNGGVIAAGDLVYLDNDDTGLVAGTAPTVFHNMYMINKDTWQWYVWQDITNYTEQLIGLEFVKVAGQTQYEFTKTGLMELFTETPTLNGRYKYTIDAKFDRNLTM